MKKKSECAIQMNCRIDEETKKRLEFLSEYENKSMSRVMNDLINAKYKTIAENKDVDRSRIMEIWKRLDDDLR